MIVFFSLSDSFGGAEQMIFKLAIHVQKRINQPVEICFYGSKTNTEWQKYGFDIHYSNNSLKNLYSYCKSKKYKAVFSSHLMMNAILGFFRALNVLKTEVLIVRESTSVFGRYLGYKLFKYKLAYKLGYQKIDLIITQTDIMRSTLLKNASYLQRRSKIVTIPNPFEYPNTKTEEEVIDIKGRYIVAAGRFIPEKGFDILIQSYHRIWLEYPDIKLVILGEGPLMKEIQKQTSESGLDDKIILKGFVNNVYPYFKQAEACIVSSIREGFPNVLLQMMSQNNTVISTKCAGGIENIRGIYIAEINDANSLYMAIKKGLDNNNDANTEIFEKELKKRTIESFAKQIKAALEKL